jgi:regulator of nucleoside diphosphate kinase
MSDETCILTTKDLTILEVMLDRRRDRDDSLVPVLKRKINSAVIMFRDDVPENVATLSSRVAFSIDGKAIDTRIISHEAMTSPTGMFLPITSLRGLALLGLVEGQEFRLGSRDAGEERIRLDKVHYQPEAAKRAGQAVAKMARPRPDRASLRLVGDFGELNPRRPVAAADGFDDPGPSAA